MKITRNLSETCQTCHIWQETEKNVQYCIFYDIIYLSSASFIHTSAYLDSFGYVCLSYSIVPYISRVKKMSFVVFKIHPELFVKIPKNRNNQGAFHNLQSHLSYQYTEMCVLIIHTFCGSLLKLCVTKHKCRSFLWHFFQK